MDANTQCAISAISAIIECGCRHPFYVTSRTFFDRIFIRPLRVDASAATSPQREICRSRAVASRACSNILAANRSISVNGGGNWSAYRLTCAASSGCFSRVKMSLTASHARRTSLCVRTNVALPGSTRRAPPFSSRATASARSRMCVDSPRKLARQMPSNFRGHVSPRTWRSVAFAGTPSARR